MAIIFRIDSRVQQVAKRVVEHFCKVSIIELGLQVVPSQYFVLLVLEDQFS